MKAPNGGYKISTIFTYNNGKLANELVTSEYFNDETKEPTGYRTENYSYKNGVTITNLKIENQFYPEENKTYKYTYNNYNLPIKEKLYNHKNKLIETSSYTYKYDEFDNWIVKKQSINDTLVYVRTRIISYK